MGLPSRSSRAAVGPSASLLAFCIFALASFPSPSWAQAERTTAARATNQAATEQLRLLRQLLLLYRDCKDGKLEKACTPEQPQAMVLPANALTRSLGIPVSSSEPETRMVGNTARFLVEAHATYKRLKEDRNAAKKVFESSACTSAPDKPAADQCARLGEEIRAFDEVLSDVQETVHDLMTRENLYWPMAAVLRTAFVIADPGDEDSAAFARSELTAKNTAAGAVDFELKHWRDEESPVDFSIDGRFGYAPVMAIGRPRGQTGPVESQKLVPLFQNGFIWEAGFKASWQLDLGELAAIYKAGQTRISDLAVKLGSDENAQLADVVRNGVGRFAWRHDVGVQFRFYGVSMPLAHHDASRLLTPLVSAAAGVRLDERFNDSGDLQSFPDANKRWFIKFSVNILKFLRDGEPKPNDPMGVRIAVDYDGPMGGSKDRRVPSGTRLFIEGNADLLKLFGFDAGQAKK